MSRKSSVEREIKLRFPSSDAALAAMEWLGATLVRAGRLQDDLHLDTGDRRLDRRGCTLRVRRDGDQAAVVTWKGPLMASTMKLREEIESTVGDADVLLRVFSELGFRARFRYQKYRTEFRLDDLLIAIDETPIGVYVELEGSEAAITAAAERLGRTPQDYVVASYRSLFLESRGADAGDMVFDQP